MKIRYRIDMLNRKSTVHSVLFPIKPMLSEASEPFDSRQHLYEIKWDGTRCISFVNEKQVLQNRRLVDITKRYPEIKIEIKAKQAVFDGEIVVMDKGLPQFRLLQQREHIEDAFRIKLLSQRMPASYIVFDMLYLNNENITTMPLLDRKKILAQTLLENEHVFLCDYVLEKGKQYFEEAVKKGLEGVMAKDIESPYLTGKRSSYWLKIKKSASIDAIICGITEGGAGVKNTSGRWCLAVMIKKSFGI
jgi:ATP-dependent DNA ligase